MSNGLLFYIFTLLIYGGVDAIACLGLNQQFGVAGVTNFGFIIFQAAGAYTASILSLPADSANGGFQSYLGGLNLPFPIPWIGAAVIGGLVALPFTFLVGRRLRGDFAAIGLLVTAVMANLLVTNYRPFLNGAAGLSLVPSPLQGSYNPQSSGYQWVYSIGTILLAAGTYFFLRRITESPYGRSLRAMRDNDIVAESLGKNLIVLRATMLVVGGSIAGLSGGILVGFINLWAPSGWGYAETIVLFAAIIIGGAGNHKGAILGAILVPLGFEEVTRFIPPIGSPELIPALQWVAIGLLIVGFIWFRPNGILPEKRRIISGARGASRNGTLEVISGQESGDVDDREYITARPNSSGAYPGVSVVAPLSSLEERNHPAGGVREDIILQVQGLSREFAGVTAVDSISISVPRGQLCGLIGPNGAGKSTTLAMLAGTLPSSNGIILYNGQNITSMAPHERARQGIVRTFQLASEFKKLTVMENLLSAIPNQPGDSFRGALYGKRYWGDFERTAIIQAQSILERFGMSQHADSYAGGLSGGQRRLVEIMRALLAEPQLLLLDEPMAGVHPRLAHQIGRELVELCRGGMSIVMVEHELSIMDEFCDPVIVMAEGKVLASGTMEYLRGRPEVVEAYLVG